MKINLIEYFVETVSRFGERVAVVDGERCITFNEVDVSAHCGYLQLQESADSYVYA